MAADVVTYTDPACGHCRELKRFLADSGVGYTDRNVAADPDAAADLDRMDVPGLPVTLVGPDVVVGFDRERLAEAFQAHGVPTRRPA